MLNLKKNPFCQKISLKKELIPRHNMQPNTHTRRDNKGKIYVKNQKKFMQDPKPTEKQDTDPEQDPKPTEKYDTDPDPKKIIPDPQP